MTWMPSNVVSSSKDLYPKNGVKVLHVCHQTTLTYLAMCTIQA